MRDYTLLFTQHNKEAPPLTFLAGDMSLRRYYRFWEGEHPYILMDAPAPENPQRFCEVADFISSLGLSAPRVLQQDFDQGYLILEDFGDQTFTWCLNKGYDPEPLYQLAIDVLVDLHTRIKEPPFALEAYTLASLIQEVEVFFDWYWPQRFGVQIESALKAEALSLWADAFEQTLNSSMSLVLRDFHVDNLVWLGNRQGLKRCGLLDFQDAVWGPKVYDVISLLEDARRDLSPQLVMSLWERYCAAFRQESPQELWATAMILSAGRHLKIIGVFTRFYVRNGKPDYLAHLPRVWRLFYQCLETPRLFALKQWFHEYVPTH